ncbi:MAG TPA: DUF5131 family protein, partial [Candidatus Tectomicrobia bacterium]
MASQHQFGGAWTEAKLDRVRMPFIQRVFDTMHQASHHVFQILTKRSARLLEVAQDLSWSENIWMGVNVEDDQVICRIRHLQQIPAPVRFLSCEPLIGPLDALPLEGIHWVIVGG